MTSTHAFLMQAPAPEDEAAPTGLQEARSLQQGPYEYLTSPRVKGHALQALTYPHMQTRGTVDVWGLHTLHCEGMSAYVRRAAYGASHGARTCEA